MATSTNIVNTLGAGSGIDIKTLAQNLADAEINPRKDAVNAKLSKTEAKISGLGYLKTALADLKTAFAQLDDATDFASIKASNSQPAAIGISTTSSAQTGSYAVEVNQLARAQRSASNGFAARDTRLNAGSAFTLNLSVNNGVAKPITVSTDTPAGVVSAINSANLGVQAQLLMTGDALKPYTVVVSGESGALKNFTLTPASQALVSTTTQNHQAGLAINAAANATEVKVTYGDPATDVKLVRQVESGLWTWPAGTTEPAAGTPLTVQTYAGARLQPAFSSTLQTAADAQLKVNGLSVTRSSNQVSDLIEGVTLDLTTTTSSPVRIDLSRETASIKDKFRGLVSAYNDLEVTLKELGNAKSTIKDGGGSLVGDSILQSVRNQVRSLITNESSTPGNTVKTARQAGLSFDRNGQLTLDEAKLEKALQDHFDEVNQVFSAGSSGKSLYSSDSAGVAGDAVVKLDQMLRSSGLIANQTESANKKIDAYKADLSKLDERLSQTLQRYIQQFSVMESIVGSNNSLKTSLKSSFEGMMSMYTNK